jgi:hypothetical protein
MAKDVIPIAEAEATSDFAALMVRVRAGARVIIENGQFSQIRRQLARHRTRLR